MGEVDGGHSAASELAEYLELAGGGSTELCRDLRPRVCFFASCLVGGGDRALGPHARSGSAPGTETIGGAQRGAAPFTTGYGCGGSAKAQKRSPGRIRSPHRPHVIPDESAGRPVIRQQPGLRERYAGKAAGANTIAARDRGRTCKAVHVRARLAKCAER